MRIAMLGHKRFPSREGGVEVVVGELATRMAALGHEVTVYSRKGRSAAGADLDDPMFQRDEYEHQGVRVRQIPTIDVRGLAAATSSLAAMRAAVADAPDVIHVHAEGPCAALPIAKRAGVRTVATIHGLDWQRAKWGRVGSAYIRRGERAAVKCADEVVVLSEGVQGYFRSQYGRETRFIPNGIEPRERLRPQIISEKHGLEEGSYVLFLGRIVPEKGLHHLLEAYREVGTDRRLVVAGGPSDSRAYYERVRANAEKDPRVLFAGFVQGRELGELYSSAAVYVLPSDLEGMPMSLLEAMAYGCCCLTSDVPECADVLGGAGATFRRGDARDLATRLRGLLEDDGRRAALGEAARRRVEATYDWDSVVERTLSLYRGGAK